MRFRTYFDPIVFHRHKMRIQELACLIMLLGLYSVGTISSIIESWTFTYILIASSIFISLIADPLNVLNIKINGLLFWAIPLVICVIGSFRVLYAQDVVMYLLVAICLLLISNYSNDTVMFMFKILIFFSVIFALGEFWQYFYQEAYYKYIYPLFPAFYQQSIRRQLYFNKMYTGLTTQTVVSAEFILLGIVSVYYFIPTVFVSKRKPLFYGILLLLLGGLLLTGKRSPILFLAMSIIYTEIKTSPLNTKLSRTLKIMLVILLIVIVTYSFVLPKLSDTRNSFSRIMEYLDSDTDASNGRFELFSDAIAGFRQSPWLGQGWGWFKKKYEITGAHNVYLQLLCECGTFGAIPIIAIFFWWYIRLSIVIRRILSSEENARINPCMKFVFFSHVYILLYCMVGNPIYDYCFLIWYMIVIGLSYNSLCSVNGNIEYFILNIGFN